MNTEEERNRILSNLRNLNDIPEYKTIRAKTGCDSRGSLSRPKQQIATVTR